MTENINKMTKCMMNELYNMISGKNEKIMITGEFGE